MHKNRSNSQKANCYLSNYLHLTVKEGRKEKQNNNRALTETTLRTYSMASTISFWVFFFSLHSPHSHLMDVTAGNKFTRKNT